MRCAQLFDLAKAMGATLLICLVCAAGSHAATGRLPAVPLPSASDPVVLGPYFERRIDPAGRLGFDDVRGGAGFEPNPDPVPNLGYTSSALWLRFRLPEDAGKAGELLLEIRLPVLDRIEFYVPHSDGQGGTAYRATVVGDWQAWNTREVQDRNFLFRLNPHAEPFYLRITNQGTLFVPAYLWRADAFASHSRASQVAFGLFYGMVLALILYNLMLFASVRDRAYLYYALYGATFAGFLLGLDGFLFEYAGPGGGWWSNNALVMFVSLALLFGPLFASRFLDLPQIAPWIDRALKAIASFAGLLAICSATGWLISYQRISQMIATFGIVTSALIIVAAVRALLVGNRTARFFLLAWTVMLLGLVVFPLSHLGLVPYTAATYYGIHTGLALDLILLSLALGDRINLARREADRARSEARAMDIASRHKSEFLASMSHELRTPLNAVMGFSEMLQERYFGDLNAKQAEYVRDIREAGGHLLSLVNDILDLSKVEAGRMELELTEFDLPAAVDTALVLVRERASQHGITLRRNLDASLGLIRADERKLKQILLNLLSNAVKFTPNGGRIDVAAKSSGGMVEISVADSGVGIAPEEQKLVFEEFRQAGRDAVRRSEGTGLGLALTKRFVELHGGSIRLESAPGRGSTFIFTLPLTATQSFS